MALLNAHILYVKTGGTKTFLQFSHHVIADLIFAGDVTPPDKVESVVSNFVDLYKMEWNRKVSAHAHQGSKEKCSRMS